MSSSSTDTPVAAAGPSLSSGASGCRTASLDDDASLASRLASSATLDDETAHASSAEDNWIRHESFIHPLDQLSDGEHIEDGLLTIDDLDGEAYASQASHTPAKEPEPGPRKSESSSSDFLATHDSEMRAGSLLGSMPMSPSTEASALLSPASHDGHLESFFDAVSPSPEQGELDIDVNSDGEADFASTFDGHPTGHASVPSDQSGSPTRRWSRPRDLHHQDSTATLMGLSDPRGALSSSSSSKSTLPPPRPTPTTPLPMLPDDLQEAGEPSVTASASTSSLSSRAPSNSSAASSAQSPPRRTSPKVSPTPQLGPSGTLRGRPRGATIGALPGAHAVARPRTRPRSLLSHEITPEDVAAAASSFASGSTQKKRDIGAYDTHARRAVLDGERAVSSVAPKRDDESIDPSSSILMSMTSVGTSGVHAGQRAQASGSRSRSGSNTSLLQQVHLRTRPRASFVIAVVGHVGAGKSTVIKKGLRQFGLSKPQVISDKITSHSTMCIVDHEQRTIEVLEVDAAILLHGATRRFAWPKFLPRIDAAILCYDASEEASFRGMAELLENFALSSISTVMLACKSEKTPRSVDPYYVSDIASVYNVGLAECSVQSEEGKKRMKDCFSFLVRAVAKARAQNRTLMGEGLDEGSNGKVDAQDADARIPPSERSANRKASGGTDKSHASEEDDFVHDSISRAQLGVQSAKTAGGYVSIEELYDKLFFAAVSGNDERFLLMFMTFYRGFARPLDLLRQIVSRFEALARGEHADGIMIRYSLMKLTTMLGDWMHEYPGDLSDTETYAVLTEFFERIMKISTTKHVAAPMLPLLEAIEHAPDLDAAWAKSQDSEKAAPADAPPMVRGASRGRSSSTASSAPGRGEKRDDSMGPTEVVTTAVPVLERPLLDGRLRSSSDATQSSGHDSLGSASMSTGSGPDGSVVLKGATAAPPLSPTTASITQPEHEQKTVLRSLSNALFEVKDESIAHELTRIEWDLFSKIGPRDLLRHILVSRDSRSPESPVAQSIAHFNYVSAWVGSMILSQSKTKQRARMLEKFIGIASILRRINNYNTLHAILAGLGNAAVHRLKHTNELLNGKRIYKTYQSLTRLMGSDRSFAAYRLALENSEGRTIPYLGVHLQDILSTSDGNPSKRKSDGAIHWRKFSLMYDAVMAIVRCQEYEMGLQPNASVARLVMNIPIMSEDAMYHRSLQLEPRQVGTGTSAPGSRIIRNFFHAEVQ